MVWIGQRVEGAARNVVRVLRIGADDRQHLSAHPFDRHRVKARLDQRGAQKIHRRVAVLGQHPRRDRERVGADIEGKARREILPCGLEGAGVHLGRSFFEKTGHQVHRAKPVGIVEPGAPFEAQLERREGDGVVLDQPGVDAARRSHLLDLDLGMGQTGETGTEGEGQCQDADHLGSTVNPWLSAAP